MHTRGQTLAALTAFGLLSAMWSGPVAGETQGRVCGHAISWRAPGTTSAYEPIRPHAGGLAGLRNIHLRVAPIGDKTPQFHLYLVSMDEANARLVFAGSGRKAGEQRVGLPSRIVALCTRQPLSWLAGERPGASIEPRYRSTLEAWSGQFRRSRPKGLGPEVHRPDYEGFEIIGLPGGIGSAALVLDLKLARQ